MTRITKRADRLESGDRIKVDGLGGGGTVIRTADHADPGRIKIGYRYGTESWQKTSINARRDADITIITEEA